jgi:hypothetical protein
MNDHSENNSAPTANNNAAAAGRDINLSFALRRGDLFWYNFHFQRLLAAGAAVFFVLAIVGSIAVLRTPIGDLRTALIWLELGFGIGFSICGGSVAGVALQIFIFKTSPVKRAMSRRSFVINSYGVAIFNEQGRIDRSWKDIKTIIKTRHGFYLRTSDKLAIVIPRRELKLQNDLEAFKAILKRQ